MYRALYRALSLTQRTLYQGCRLLSPVFLVLTQKFSFTLGFDRFLWVYNTYTSTPTSLVVLFTPISQHRQQTNKIQLKCCIGRFLTMLISLSVCVPPHTCQVCNMSNKPCSQQLACLTIGET